MPQIMLWEDKCLKCGEVFLENRKFHAHMRKHKPKKCRYCSPNSPQFFEKKTELAKHVSEKHCTCYTCEATPVVFPTVSRLNKHKNGTFHKGRETLASYRAEMNGNQETIQSRICEALKAVKPPFVEKQTSQSIDTDESAIVLSSDTHSRSTSTYASSQSLFAKRVEDCTKGTSTGAASPTGFIKESFDFSHATLRENGPAFEVSGPLNVNDLNISESDSYLTGLGHHSEVDEGAVVHGYNMAMKSVAYGFNLGVRAALDSIQQHNGAIPHSCSVASKPAI